MKIPRDDDGGGSFNISGSYSVRVQAAVVSGGGSCDGGFVAPSVCPAGGQTAVVPLVQLQRGPRTPWTAGPGSVPAFSQHSRRPAGTHGLQEGTQREMGSLHVTQTRLAVCVFVLSLGLYPSIDQFMPVVNGYCTEKVSL